VLAVPCVAALGDTVGVGLGGGLGPAALAVEVIP
jgi:hypothetical protein